MIVPFAVGDVHYEFEEDVWRRISAGEWDDQREPPLPVLRELLRMRRRQLDEKQALIDEYAQCILSQAAEIAMLRQHEETK